MILAAFLAVAHAGVVSVGYQDTPVYSQQAYAAPVYSQPGYGSPVVAKVAAPVIQKTIYAEPEAPAHYNFEYSVHDDSTGDIKTQQESREGDVVHGSYSLIDADGYKRIVEYTSDDHSGFNAVVRREPLQGIIKTPVVAKVPAPVYAASPVVSKVAYAAPGQYYH